MKCPECNSPLHVRDIGKDCPHCDRVFASRAREIEQAKERAQIKRHLRRHKIEPDPNPLTHTLSLSTLRWMEGCLDFIVALEADLGGKVRYDPLLLTEGGERFVYELPVDKDWMEAYLLNALIQARDLLGAEEPRKLVP